MKPARRRVLFIYAFLGLQALAPLHYYACRSDRRDERWAWRMFSPERMTRCEVQFRVGPEHRPVALWGRFHEAWIALAERGRTGVIEAMAAALCRTTSDVRVHMRCRAVDGRSDEPSRGGFNLCLTRSL